jgi:DNA methylase
MPLRPSLKERAEIMYPARCPRCGGRGRNKADIWHHEDDSGRAVVLDSFAGAGTTNLVATQLGRDSIGIELNPDYAEMAEDRIRRWEANPAGHLKSKPLDIEGQGSLLDLHPEENQEGAVA